MELFDQHTQGIAARPSEMDSVDQGYRQLANEMAARAGCIIEIRGNDAFVDFEYSEEWLCALPDVDKPWSKIWMEDMARFPEWLRTHRYY